MCIFRYSLLCIIFILVLTACAPEPETAVSPTLLPATATTLPTATAVPATATEQVTSTSTATAVPTTIPSPTVAFPMDPSIISPENAGQLTQLAQFGNGRIDSLTWSPDGTTFAVGGSQGIDLYDSETLQLRQTIQDDQLGEIIDLRFDSAAEFLVITLGGYETVRVVLWNAVTGQYVRDLYDAFLPEFLPDGSLVYFDWAAQQMVWHDPISGETLQAMSLPFSPWAFSPADQMIAGLDENNAVQLYDQVGMEVRHVLELPDVIDDVVFSPAGDLLATASRDGVFRIWDVHTGALQHEFEGREDWVSTVLFSPDGSFLATNSSDKIIHIWDTATGEHLNEIYVAHHLPHKNAPLFAFSPDGRELAVTSGGSILFFDAHTSRYQHILGGYSFTKGVTFSPDGRTLISVNGYDVQTIDVDSGQLIEVVQYDRPVHSIVANPISNLIAWGGGEETFWLQMWKVATNQLIYTLEADSDVIWKVRFSPDGRLLAVQNSEESAEPMVTVYDALSADLLFSVTANRFALSNDGRFLATSTWSNASNQVAVDIWDTSSFQQVNHLPGLMLLAFGPDGTILANAYESGTTGWWDAASGTLSRPFQNDYTITSVHSFSPDGRLLLATSSFGELFIWDIEAGVPLWSGDRYGSGTFSPYGRFLATISSDGIVRLWRLQ